MNNELQVFNFKENNVRTTIIKGNPYFCLKDVCGILDIKNHKEVVSRLNTKGVDTADLLTNGGIQNATFINESNLYKVIFQSRKEEAEQFQDWVTSDVLPIIRKTGAYSTVPTTYKEALQHLLIQVEENEKLQLANSEMKPKAQYFDCLVERNLLLNFRDTAKELKVKAKEFNNFLLDSKYVYRDQKGQLKPYADYVENGLFEIKEFVSAVNSHAGNQTLITPKGRETFRMLLQVMA